MTGPLSAAEIVVLRSGGADPFGGPNAFEDADVELADLLDGSLSVPEVAELLGCSPTEVERRIVARWLYGLRASNAWRLPVFQFAGRVPVPGLAEVLMAVPTDVEPVGFARWFTSSDVDLVVGPDETPLSPRDWLRGGGGPGVVSALAREL